MDEDTRLRRLFALADPVRLAVVDELTASDRAPVELRERLGVESNLLAHHLDVLEEAGIIGRSRSSGDGRRRYVHLLAGALDGLVPTPSVAVSGEGVLFVCTHNSARSQLAAALWDDLAGGGASSAGTHPAAAVHPGAVAAARRAGLDLTSASPRLLETTALPPLVVTVCDRAHEELDPAIDRLHWSVPDPVATGDRTAFDATVVELRDRISSVLNTRRVA